MSWNRPATVEAWAKDYVLSDTYAAKLKPVSPPRTFAETPLPERIESPGRGPEFSLRERSDKSSGSSALKSEGRRARLLHTFLHHELAAAELMAWAILAFPSSPVAFRRGLLGILLDEIRHMNLYADLLERRGHPVGSIGVRDWFWERIPSAKDPRMFVATMGIGFEAANLDHTARFADRFGRAGDEEARELTLRIGREEIPHVRFAQRWFSHFCESDGRPVPPIESNDAPRSDDPFFEAWRACLPEPLSPALMRGDPIDRDARAKAGQSQAFVDALAAWPAP